MMTHAACLTRKLTRAFPRVHIVQMALHLLPGPFTLDTYHRLAELGILDEDDRVELLDGQIVAMTPIGGAHAACVIRLTDLLSRRGGTPASTDSARKLIGGLNPDTVTMDVDATVAYLKTLK